MDVHRLRGGASAECLDNLCPDRANRAQFGNLQEEVRAHGERKENLPRRFVDGKTAR